LISSKISVLLDCESYTIMGGITGHIWSHYEESDLGIFSLWLWDRLVEIPGCILVGLLGLIVDTPIISLVALAKSPLMLLKGWRQLILDLVGQPSSCVACGPFAGLAIVLWPLVVCATVLSAIFCSPFLGLFGAVIVYQENSFCLGLSHVVAVVAEFDEYSNDVLHLNEGSCLPRYNFTPKETNRARKVLVLVQFHLQKQRKLCSLNEVNGKFFCLDLITMVPKDLLLPVIVFLAKFCNLVKNIGPLRQVQSFFWKKMACCHHIMRGKNLKSPYFDNGL
jgi:hypothetical protein